MRVVWFKERVEGIWCAKKVQSNDAINAGEESHEGVNELCERRSARALYEKETIQNMVSRIPG